MDLKALKAKSGQPRGRVHRVVASVFTAAAGCTSK